MALPNTLQVINQLASQVDIEDLGIPIAASATVTLTDYATMAEIRGSLSLHGLIDDNSLLIGRGNGAVTKAESLAFFLEFLDQGGRNKVDLVATVNIATLSGTSTSIDGTTATAGFRVLLTAQTDSKDNGVYQVKSGAWTRPYDMLAAQGASGASVVATRGTDNGDAIWVCSSDPGSDVVGTNDLFFSKQEGDTAAAGANVLAVAGYRHLNRVDILTEQLTPYAVPGFILA